MKKTIKTVNHILDVRDSLKIAKLNDWCRDNLQQDEYESIVMGMCPLWWRYKFHCPKNKLIAILST